MCVCEGGRTNCVGPCVCVRERERLFKLGWVWEREGEYFCASEIDRERERDVGQKMNRPI